MIVNIEFLSEEPIENMMTSMHFAVDKTIFFGYEEIVESKKKVTERFLKKYCGVKDVEFCALPENRLETIVKTMRKVIRGEQEKGNQVFIDITGGEDLLLVAFGMVAQSEKLPLHILTCRHTDI